MPAGVVHSGSVDVWEPLARPGHSVGLHPGPGFPLCGLDIGLSTTSHHDCFAQVNAACPTEILF